MKKLKILISIIFITNGFSQNPNPDLFQTWYLRTVKDNALTQPYLIWEITPTITPTLTIFNDLSFTGTGSCNTFTGSFANMNSLNYQQSSFSATEIVCNSPLHNSVEDSYFGFLQSQMGNYYIFPDGNGLTLQMVNPSSGGAQFQNYPLETKSFNIEPIAIFPNPVNSIFSLNSNQLMILEIQIINSVGETVRTINKGFEIIDISNLSSGIYLLKMKTEHEVMIKKIVKK